MDFDRELDTRGLNCPLPKRTGHELLQHGEASREFTFFMRTK